MLSARQHTHVTHLDQEGALIMNNALYDQYPGSTVLAAAFVASVGVTGAFITGVIPGVAKTMQVGVPLLFLTGLLFVATVLAWGRILFVAIKSGSNGQTTE
jgi:cation transporter-like permease